MYVVGNLFLCLVLCIIMLHRCSLYSILYDGMGYLHFAHSVNRDKLTSETDTHMV